MEEVTLNMQFSIGKTSFCFSRQRAGFFVKVEGNTGQVDWSHFLKVGVGLSEK